MSSSRRRPSTDRSAATGGDTTLKGGAPRNGDRIAEQFRILDLHDEVGQLLTAILANLHRLGSTAAGAPLQSTIRDTQSLVENIFYTIRGYVRGARSRREGLPDLVPALREMASAFTGRTGVGVRFLWGCDPEVLSREHKTVLYRVVQESLTNAFRHTEATVVTVAFTRSGRSVSLTVEDDGGAGPRGRGAGAAGGNGLRGMRERVRLIGGECSARFVEGRGMRVSVTLPYNIS